MTASVALPAGIEAASSVLTLVVPAKNGCDLKCPFCFIKQRGEQATVTELLPADYVRFITDTAARRLVDAICIQGYEPLLPNAFAYTEEILAAGHRLGIPTSLVTNGTHLRQHVPALAKLKPARIAVSLDGAEAAIHDRQRGKTGTFDDAILGLKFAISVPVLKKALVVASVLMPKKRDRLTNMPKLLSGLGLNRWVVNALLKMGKGDELVSPAGQRDSIFDDLLALKVEADRYGVDMVVDDEFGRLSDNDRARELLEMEALRIKRLAQPEGVYRLAPTRHCSKGADILKPVHAGTPVWNPSMDAGEFLASIDTRTSSSPSARTRSNNSPHSSG